MLTASNAYDNSVILDAYFSLNVVLSYFLTWSDLGKTLSTCPVQNSMPKHFTRK